MGGRARREPKWKRTVPSTQWFCLALHFANHLSSEQNNQQPSTSSLGERVCSPRAEAEGHKVKHGMEGAPRLERMCTWSPECQGVSTLERPSPSGSLSLPRAGAAAAAAAKSLQSCPTLCDPIDGSPPGSPIPGILQARTLEWAAISFSSALK